ncbi:MAG: alpha/beta fold hydrolase [Flavobacteriaceae bacterium]|nr:alpha/beta fold hydrolase [Flavobacteriaceae bacterium]
MLLYSKILGKGQPLLILHGFLGMGDNWKSLANRFAENYEVHLIDQRNHGRSFHTTDFSYELMVEDLHNYIKHYSLKKVNLLGHSMGGKTAMLFAVTFPEMISKLIVADISPRYYPIHHQLILEALNTVDFSVQKTRREVAEILKKYINENGIRQFLLKNIYWKSKGELAYRFNLECLTKNIEEVGIALPSFTNFNNKVLFLKGENSNYISKNDNALINAHFPKAIVKTVKNAGHWLHAENPTDFYNHVVDFLK